MQLVQGEKVKLNSEFSHLHELFIFMNDKRFHRALKRLNLDVHLLH
jgi:hypothetical protein